MIDTLRRRLEAVHSTTAQAEAVASVLAQATRVAPACCSSAGQSATQFTSADRPRPRRRSIGAVLAMVLAAACGGGSGAGSSDGVQSFLMGPPEDMKGQELRFQLLVPRAYLPPKFRSGLQPEEAASRVPFIALLADFSAAGDLSTTAPGIVVGNVGWAPEGFVRSQVDGSWLNSLSRYSQAAGTRFGLEMRTPPEHRYVPAELYVSLEPGQQVIIECAYLRADRPQYCQLSSQRPGKPLVELWFREDDLPGWRAMTGRAHELVATWAAVEKEARR